MRLLRLEAHDWLSYADLDLDFSDLDQVVVVGQNGHGKSALLDALLYCLFGDGRASADQMIRTGATSAWVRVTLSVSGREVVVTRTRSMETRAGETGLQVSVAGARQTKHTIAETQTFINGLIGVTTEVLMATAVMVQGHSDELMRATPSMRKEYLIDLFGLGLYETLHAQSKDKAATAKGQTVVLEAQLSNLTAERESISMDVFAQGHRIAMELDEAIVSRDQLAEQIAATREEAVSLKERKDRVSSLTFSIDMKNKDLGIEQGALARESASLEEERKKAKAVLTLDDPPAIPDISSAEAFYEAAVRVEHENLARIGARDQWSAQLARLERAERLVASVPCHAEGEFASCQFLVDARDVKLLEEARAQMRVLADVDSKVQAATTESRAAKATLDEARSFRDRAIKLKGDHDSIIMRHTLAVSQAEGMITVHERGIAQTKDRIASINGEISRLNAERLPLMQDFTRIDAIVGELKGLLEQWERAKADVDRLTAEKAASEAAQRRYQDLNAQVGLVTGRLDVAAREYDLYAVLSELFHRDGIPTLILENGLGAIEKKANDVLERMPGSFALEIITQKANKTNSILKETLDVVVLVDGQERAYELLSGGERFRVDFALRIGLASVLGHRAGSSIRTLWLDEPLAALDANGREAVVESLSAVSDDFELVVVVSHHDEFSDRLPARINVTKTDGISTARIAA